MLVLVFCRLAFPCSYSWVQRQCTIPTSPAALQEEEESGSLVHSSESKSESSELFARVLAARALSIKGVRAFLDFSTQEVHPEKEGTFAACKHVCRLSLSKHHQAMYSCHCRRCRVGGAGRGCGACSADTSLRTSGATQRRWNRARLALYVISSITESLPSLLPPGLWSTVLAKRAIPVLDYGVVG